MKVIIWGAGQGGRMVGNLLHGDMTVVAYCDRDEKKWGRTLGGVPIVPPAELQALKPDLIFISMLNKDACAAVTAQLRELSPGARIMTAVELRELFDLRLAR